MSHICKTVKIKASHPSQGDFVEINEEDFDPEKHELYAAKAAITPPAAVVDYSEAVKKLAEEHNLDLSQIKGSGKNGTVTVKDVKGFMKDNTVDFASDEAGELVVELGLTPEQVAEIVGSGQDGTITVEDVQKYVDDLTKE